MLREEFLVPLGITQSELAERMGVPVGRVGCKPTGSFGMPGGR